MKRALSHYLREWGVLTLVLMGLMLLAVRGDWFDRANFWVYDKSVALSQRAPAPDILILAIDEASLARFGRWPWSREKIAQVLEKLTAAGTGPVLLDVIFSEPERDDPLADERLARAIRAHGRVVLPVFNTIAGAPMTLPLPALVPYARLGHAQALIDPDGVSRRYLAVETALDKGFSHVAFGLMEAAGQAPPMGAVAGDGGSAARLVSFAGPPGHFPRHSLVSLLDGQIPDHQLRGKTVLFGATAIGLGDNLVTPLAGVSGTMPGVEFVANVLDGMRNGLEPRPLGWLAQTLLGCALLCVLMGIFLISTPRMALAATALMCLAAAVLSWAGLRLSGVWWPPAATMALLALAYPLWSWRRLEASLKTMTDQSQRMAALAQQPLRTPRTALVATTFSDSVENRIQAITEAVNQIASAFSTGAHTLEIHQHRESMMRHLAHDLRSPLVSLRSLADNLKNQNTAESAAMLERIDACARRALDLSDQFLLMSRAESIDPASFTGTDLVQIMHQAADDVSEDAHRSGSRIMRQCTLDIALVDGDARLLQRALLNMGWNALRHGPAGGTVTLSLTADTNGYVLGVHDEGSGFSPHALARLTQPYAQAGQQSQGHGLGLAFVSQVAQKHGARLQAEHPADGGFRLTLHIPSVHLDLPQVGT